MVSRLREEYDREIQPKLKERLTFANNLAVPRLLKIVINVGIGDIRDNQAAIDKAMADLTALAGQKPVISKAKKSIANFKLSRGQPIGMMVTLRGDRMYQFFDKLVNIVLPKVRDFRGISDISFDGQGNFSLGVKEQSIFSEVGYQSVGQNNPKGLEISIVTTAKNKDQGKILLECLGMPFKKEANG